MNPHVTTRSIRSTRRRLLRRALSAVGVLGVGIAVLPGHAAAARPPGPSATGPAATLASMTEAERVGQLFMVGTVATRADPAALDAVRRLHVGSVILTGRSTRGSAATRHITDQLRAAATPSNVGILVATDQEGGNVQVLRGPGFAPIPTAVAQGKRSPAALRALATVWGQQLTHAGVDLDLGPVFDTVPASLGTANAPIGRYGREFGHTPGGVAGHGVAAQQGLQAGGVATTAKHFPGLGRVRGNTDTTRGVTDPAMTRHDAEVTPFAAAIAHGSDVVMMSSAAYPRIDPRHRAVFSPTVIGGMLRGDLKFDGVVMSDSLNAVGVNDLAPATRAIRFIAAGGDLALADDARTMSAMVSGVLARARQDPPFARRVDAAALHVLTLKQRTGLSAGSVAATGRGGGESLVQRWPGHGLRIFDSADHGARWSAPSPLDGRTWDGPAIAAIPGGSAGAVAATGPDGKVYLRDISGHSAAGGWRSMGGVGTSGPAVARSGRGTTVAVRGSHGGIFVRDANTGRGWTGLGGIAASAPVMSATPSGSLVLAVTGPDQRVYLRTRTNAGWSPHWISPGGRAFGRPALTVAPDTGAVTVVVRSTGGQVWLHHGASAAGGWSGLGGHLVAAPAAAAARRGELDVLGTGIDGRLWHRSHSGSGWTPWRQLPR